MIKRAFFYLTGGRPMRFESSAFRDIVSGRMVHYWRDHLGRRWLAEHAWSWFRMALEKTPDRPDRSKWLVVYMPTALGFVAFGWTPRVHDICDTKDDANMSCYLANCDDPAPDAREYARYVVVPPFKPEMIL